MGCQLPIVFHLVQRHSPARQDAFSQIARYSQVHLGTPGYTRYTYYTWGHPVHLGSRLSSTLENIESPAARWDACVFTVQSSPQADFMPLIRLPCTILCSLLWEDSSQSIVELAKRPLTTLWPVKLDVERWPLYLLYLLYQVYLLYRQPLYLLYRSLAVIRPRPVSTHWPLLSKSETHPSSSVHAGSSNIENLPDRHKGRWWSAMMEMSARPNRGGCKIWHWRGASAAAAEFLCKYSGGANRGGRHRWWHCNHLFKYDNIKGEA